MGNRATSLICGLCLVLTGCPNGSPDTDTGTNDAAGSEGGSLDGSPLDGGGIDGGGMDGRVLDGGDGSAADGDGDAQVDGGADTSLLGGPVCTASGWCWESPLPAGGRIESLWSPAPGQVIAGSRTHFFHRDPSGTILHAESPVVPHIVTPLRMWASAPNDVWGTEYMYGVHFDGFAWTERMDFIYASAIHGSGPDDVWAASGAGLQHYDGSRWSVLTTGSATYGDVWVIAPGDAIVSTNTAGQPGKVSERHLDGTVTDLGTPGGDLVFSVYASSAADVWAGSDSGLQHRVGGSWSTVATGRFFDLWGSGADNVWAISDLNTLTHWNGTSATTVTIDGMPELTGVAGTSATDVWVSDAIGALHHFDGTQWTVEKAPLANSSLFAIAPADDGEAWATGTGLLAHRTATSNWATTPPPTTANPRGVSRAGTETFYFAADGAYRLQGSSWQSVPGGMGLHDACTTSGGVTVAIGDAFGRYAGGAWTTDTLPGIPSPDNARCVGAEAWTLTGPPLGQRYGRTLHFDGTDWARAGLVSTVGMPVLSTLATTDNDAWIVLGDATTGTIVMHFDGSWWREVRVPGAGTVLAVGGSSPSNVWLVGKAGFARRWNGTSMAAADATTTANFSWVRGNADGTALAVVRDGSVWQYASGSWTQSSGPIPFDASFASRALGEAAFANGDVFAAGEYYESLRWHAGTWSSLPGNFQAQQVAANDTAGAWFLNNTGSAGHWDGTMVAPAGVGLGAGSFGGDIVVAGATAYLVDTLNAYRIENSTRVTELSVRGDARTFFGASESALWFIADANVQSGGHEVWRKAGGAWAVMPEPVEPVGFGTDTQGRLLAVGADLTIYRRESGVWSIAVPTPTNVVTRATAAHIYAPDDIWALASDAHALIHFDGAAWSSRVDTIGLGFQTMEASPNGTLFAAGDGASFVRHGPR